MPRGSNPDQFNWLRGVGEPRLPQYFGIEIEGVTEDDSDYDDSDYDDEGQCTCSDCRNARSGFVDADVFADAIQEDPSIGDVFWSKYDGSLPDYTGIEICSHPFSKQWYMENGEQVFTHLFKIGLSHGFPNKYGLDRAGTHVHFGRRGLTPPQVWGLYKLHYHYPEFTVALSRRTRRRINSWASRALNERNEREIKGSTVGCSTAGDRGAIYNQNRNHLELRIFAACENAIHALEAIEHTICMCDFVRSLSDVEDASPERYCDWLLSHAFKFQYITAAVMSLTKDTLAEFDPPYVKEAEIIEEREKAMEAIRNIGDFRYFNVYIRQTSACDRKEW